MRLDHEHGFMYILVRGYVSREGDALSVVGREYEEIETEERLAQQSRDFR